MRKQLVLAACILACGCAAGCRHTVREERSVSLVSQAEARLLEVSLLETIKCKEKHIMLELENSAGETVSPRDGLTRILQDKGYVVVDRNEVRFPTFLEKNPANPKLLRGFELKTDGASVMKYVFRILKDLGANRFVIEDDMCGGPLYGGGSKTEVVFIGGKIIRKKSLEHWIY